MMQVSIRTSNSKGGSGKKSEADVGYARLVFHHSKFVGGITHVTLEGGAEDVRGDGSRGGVWNEYTKEVYVVLTLGEVKKIATEALRLKLIALPGKEAARSVLDSMSDAQRGLSELLTLLDDPFATPKTFLPVPITAEDLDKM